MAARKGERTSGSLAMQARTLHGVLIKQARRPFVVEITGTPKAGKTSTIGLVESFFKACGWRVHVVRERAAACPIAMKGHFFFNTWTTCTMLAELVDVVDGAFDLVIVDRGLFDALIWLDLQRARAQVQADEERVFREFVLLDRWRSLIDLSIYMKVAPNVAIRREDMGQLLRRRGSLMNPRALREFNRALERARQQHGKQFRLVRLEPMAQPKTVAEEVISEILPAVTRWADPNVVAVSRDVVRTVFGTRSVVAGGARSTLLKLLRGARVVRRSLAEKDRTLVQLVACAIPTYQHGAFVFDRDRDEQRRQEYGKLALWCGTHVEGPAGGSVLGRASDAAGTRLRRDLHLNVDFRPKLLGIVYTRTGRRDRRDEQHLGLVFHVPISEAAVAESLEEKEFKTRGRGHPAKSSFVTIRKLRGMKHMEPWSAAIIEARWLERAKT